VVHTDGDESVALGGHKPPAAADLGDVEVAGGISLDFSVAAELVEVELGSCHGVSRVGLFPRCRRHFVHLVQIEIAHATYAVFVRFVVAIEQT